MFALISPDERIYDSAGLYLGSRVAQVEQEVFPVASPLHWVQCESTCIPQNSYYTNTGIHEIPPVIPTAEQNQAQAIQLLQDTDWTQEPDVGNPANNPYLMNVSEFTAYREQVREIAVNPVAGNLSWPTIPTEQWSS